MPHLSYEYSANLDKDVDHSALCAHIHAAALQTGMFELGALRVRAHRCSDYAVADLMQNNAFLHLTISIGAGRSEDTIKQAGEHIWAELTQFLAPLFETPHFALTMEFREINPALSWKKNAIHPRIRAQKT
jgi:5-carboxymethyl-2-hydroxymuconate isomerase